MAATAKDAKTIADGNNTPAQPTTTASTTTAATINTASSAALPAIAQPDASDWEIIDNAEELLAKTKLAKTDSNYLAENYVKALRAVQFINKSSKCAINKIEIEGRSNYSDNCQIINIYFNERAYLPQDTGTDVRTAEKNFISRLVDDFPMCRLETHHQQIHVDHIRVGWKVHSHWLSLMPALHREGVCDPLYQKLESQYHLPTSIVITIKQICSGKVLTTEEQNFYSTLTVLNQKNAEVFQRNAKFLNDKVQNTKYYEPFNRSNYWTCAEACYALARAAKFKGMNLFAYQMFAQVPKENIYYQLAQLDMAQLILENKIPEMLATDRKFQAEAIKHLFNSTAEGFERGLAELKKYAGSAEFTIPHLESLRETKQQENILHLADVFYQAQLQFQKQLQVQNHSLSQMQKQNNDKNNDVQIEGGASANVNVSACSNTSHANTRKSGSACINSSASPKLPISKRLTLLQEQLRSNGLGVNDLSPVNSPRDSAAVAVGDGTPIILAATAGSEGVSNPNASHHADTTLVAPTASTSTGTSSAAASRLKSTATL